MPYKDPEKKKENARLYYERNKGRIKARVKEWQKENRDRRAIHNKNWRERNRDSALAVSKKWREDNPNYFREYFKDEENRRKKRESGRRSYRNNLEKSRLRYRIQNHQRNLAPFDEDAKAYVDVISRDPCVYCGAEFEEIDHIIPLRDGGDSSWDNLAPACARCNRSKGPKTLLEFLLYKREPVDPETPVTLV